MLTAASFLAPVAAPTQSRSRCCQLLRLATAAAPPQHSPQPQQPQQSTDQSIQQLPWAFGAQTNERQLAWDAAAQIALLKIWLAERMDLTMPQVEERLAELAVLLPDITGKLERARADILYELLHDPASTAERLLALREVLPRANVSALVAGHPRLLLSMSVDEVRVQVARLRERLPGVDVDALVQAEPMLLRADLPRLMAELARLAPNADPVRLIATDPQMVLDMNAAGMPSTLEMGGVGLTGGPPAGEQEG